MAERTEQVVLDFEIDMGDSIESIDKLTAANKKLREERRHLNINTEDGKKRIQEINATIDQNTNKIKNNSSAIERQRQNIGNYRSALDGVHPALGKIGEGLEAGTKGFKAMTLQALAFIATPIGLVIAAIGAALYALTAYFKGSEEGQNRLNKIMAVGSAIMEQFMNIVEAVGETIYDAVTNPKQAIIDFGTALKENLVNRFFGILELIPNIGKAIGLLFKGQFVEASQVAFDAVSKVTLGVEGASTKVAGLVQSTNALVEQGISNGQKLANLNAKIVKDERALTELRGANDLKVAKLRQEAVELEGEAKEKVILQAIALEEELSKKEVQLAKTRLAYADLIIEANGNDIDALNEQATARANLSAAEKSAFDNTLKFRKELKGLEKEINDAIAEQIALNRANQRAANQVEGSARDPLIDAFEIRAKVITDIDRRMNDDLVKRNKETDAMILANKKKTAKMQEDIERTKLGIINDLSSGVAGLMKEDSEEQRAITSSMTLVNTYAAAMAAYKSGAEINVFFGIAAAAAAIAAGLKAVADINNVQFAEGGWTGQGNKWDIAGVVHKDEYVAPKKVVNNPMAYPHLNALEAMRVRGYADGGLVANTVTQPINERMEWMNMMKRLGPFEVSAVEMTKAQRKVHVKERLSKR